MFSCPGPGPEYVGRIPGLELCEVRAVEELQGHVIGRGAVKVLDCVVRAR